MLARAKSRAEAAAAAARVAAAQVQRDLVGKGARETGDRVGWRDHVLACVGERLEPHVRHVARRVCRPYVDLHDHKGAELRVLEERHGLADREVCSELAVAAIADLAVLA